METWRAGQECHVGITGLHRTLDSPVNFGPGEEVPQASRESPGRQQWAEHWLEAVREGQVGQPGGADFGPGVERSSGPYAKGN